ncbi:hypothetical protein MMO39_08075 [Acinetobacter modestus]|uniref:hypothetical protein n=1 Tax=Acinetobacter modestus TaxID=1776740 RepID=UPI00095B9E29|nr:hypothetical protein [Acinetobacter modestus]MCH7387256.1 hypothetical protein [Acinetobacter modestus]OJU65054.1 MAG: hypothetical protein BGN93_06385 [Acinetobacter sp. 39-4]OJU92229.1 MAG: hypothetical protein BGO19_03515 [Acinetobacter sp. 38-8]
MKKFKYLLFLIILSLQACTTAYQNRTSLPDYLQPFIGQSATIIQQQFDLKPLGFQTIAQPIKQSNQLIYTVIRPIRIPIPIAQSAEFGAQNIPIQSAGNADSTYDLNLKCHIIFELDQQQIARSIRYEGKAC